MAYPLRVITLRSPSPIIGSPGGEEFVDLVLQRVHRETAEWVADFTS
jgi:hypothetical protein